MIREIIISPGNEKSPIHVNVSSGFVYIRQTAYAIGPLDDVDVRQLRAALNLLLTESDQS